MLNKFLQKKYPFAKSYQIEGIEHILKTKRSYLGDTMGLGKTLQALLSIDFIEQLPCLIIVPNSLKINWSREVEKFINNRSFTILSTKTKTIEEKDIYIINYDILDKMKDKLVAIPFKFIVLDECHMIKNSKSLRTKALKYIVDILQCEYILMMSGTPITNRTKEFLPQFEILGRVGDVAFNSWDFLMKYTGAYKRKIKGKYVWNFDGSSNTKMLYEKMCNNFYLRREKEQVLKELPEKTRSTILFDINNRSEYDRAYNDIRQYIYETKEKKISAYAEALVKIETLKQLIAKGKLEQSIEWIENFIEQEKLVLFVHHKGIVKDLKEYFPEALTITGDDDIVSKDQAVQEFQNNDNAKLIICSIKSASVGLTLTSSSTLAFLELAWTPADHDQAEDRCHRIGQKKHVNIYYLLANNTIEDQMIMPLIEKKRSVFNQVVRGVEVSGTNDLLRDLIEMF